MAVSGFASVLSKGPDAISFCQLMSAPFKRDTPPASMTSPSRLPDLIYILPATCRLGPLERRLCDVLVTSGGGRR